jgi:hypothetical protein
VRLECSRTKPPAKVSNFRAARKDPRDIISAGQQDVHSQAHAHTQEEKTRHYEYLRSGDEMSRRTIFQIDSKFKTS